MQKNKYLLNTLPTFNFKILKVTSNTSDFYVSFLKSCQMTFDIEGLWYLNLLLKFFATMWFILLSKMNELKILVVYGTTIDD